MHERSPVGTSTYKATEERIRELLEPQISGASLEELDKFEAYSWVVRRAIADRKSELKRSQAIETIASSDEKAALIGAFHELKEDEPEIAQQALLKLAQHFPAEQLDVLPEPEAAHQV